MDRRPQVLPLRAPCLASPVRQTDREIRPAWVGDIRLQAHPHPAPRDLHKYLWGSPEDLLRRDSTLMWGNWFFTSVSQTSCLQMGIQASGRQRQEGRGSKLKTSLGSLVRPHLRKPKHAHKQANMKSPLCHPLRLGFSPTVLCPSLFPFPLSTPLLTSGHLPSLACSSFFLLSLSLRALSKTKYHFKII